MSPATKQARATRTRHRREHLGYLIDDPVTLHPDRVALIGAQTTITYGELDERSDRVAAALVRRGGQPGDRVALLWANHVEYVQTFLGVLRSGGVAVPLNTRLGDEAMASALPLPAALAARGLKHRAISRAVVRRLGPYAALLAPMLRNTVSANVVRAGEQFNVIPAEATVLLDGRVLPHLAEREFLQELTPRLPNGVETEVVRFEASRPTPDLGFFGLLADILRDGDPGGRPVPFVLPASTDGRHFGRLGIQHYGFLPMRLPPDLPFSGLVHGIDERIPVDALMFGVTAFTALLARYRG